jgi:hypothetical protein
VTYEIQTWADGEEGGTPITAAALTHIEQGIAAADQAVTDLAAQIGDVAGDQIAGVASDLAGLTTRVGAAEANLSDKATFSYVDQAAQDAVGQARTGMATTAALSAAVTPLDLRLTTAETAVSSKASTTYVDTGDAASRSRTNHTGTQAPTTIAGLDEFVRDTVGTTLVAGPNVTISVDDPGDSITISANTTTVTTTASSTDGNWGVVPLDSFAGANDDAKLTAALSATAADTYPRTILLTNRNHTFTTPNRVAFTGMRIQGPAGYGNPEQNSGQKAPGQVTLSMTGPWFINTSGADLFSVSLKNLSFRGGSGATVIGQSGTTSWYCLAMSNIYASGLRSVVGTQAAKALLTAASFTGDWECSGFYSGAFHMGGSDNTFWPDGMLIDSSQAFATAGSANGQYHIWLDFLEKSYIGPIYMTAEGAWNGIRVNGNAASGPVTIHGARIEGRNAAAPCNGSLIRVDSGHLVVRDSWISYAMASPATPGHSPADAGVIHHAGGTLMVDGCTYERANGVAETVPFVYSTSSNDLIVKSIMRGLGSSWTGRPRVTGTNPSQFTDSTVQ